jgi:agmatinase
MMNFDADAPAADNSGPYGLPHTVAQSAVVIVPVPFEATVSYRAGTALGPVAVLAASRQVDLLDGDFGAVYPPGIAALSAPAWMKDVNDAARVAAIRVIDAQTAGEPPNADDIHAVDEAGRRVNQWVHDTTAALLQQGKLPVIVGGDHSVPEGAIGACVASLAGRPLGILHLDAHCDLRVAYEGFQHSHASIMHNVMASHSSITLVQVGIRDFGMGELDAVKASGGRIRSYFDAQLRRARWSGGFASLCQAIVGQLPNDIYLSFDIDGLDPALCPSTGTPVPGGLSFDEITMLLVEVAAKGKRVVGLDLVEVAPAPGIDPELGDGWDGNVAARLLYKMIGCALRSRGAIPSFTLPPVAGL